MPKRIALTQGTPDWLAWRRGGITASMAPVIMGISPFQTPHQLWENILSEKEQEKNFSMIRGSLMEKEALHKLNDLFKMINIEFSPACYEHETLNWMKVSLDAWDDVRKVAAEIKCPSEANHRMARDGKVPDYYIPQLQHQMFVMGIDMIVYASYRNGELHLVDVQIDQYYIENKLIPAEKEFYQSIIDFKRPRVTERDVPIIIDGLATHAAENYLRIMDQIQNLQQDADLLKTQLIQHSKGESAIIGPLKMTKVMRKGAIQYENVPEMKDLDLDQYRKETVESWRIMRI